MITIVDYGLGNIKAFANVYKRLNIPACYASTAEQLQQASKLILPGVGAFDHAMHKLNNSGLRDTLDDLVLRKKIPVIGICVGMQMMAKSSEEGKSDGLGWINGTVKKFHFANEGEAKKYPLPHMGWNNITQLKSSSLIANLDDHKRFYFLHSYYFECVNSADVIASANYGFDYACVVNHENVYGIQCHPEKSHHNGVALLKNFAEL
ncbi:imidazole glycerol phosphate synthase subunit HisH 2 [Alteromonas sp. KUL42]|uniref:imidazole glycerol phosphate synthase subunit HisH n=1 Tax=Alteromonas sp. KUL42 TaxID=2480797 RepID=UPI001036159C|nr:imidazole glycerol phosphate synthase subunit HisH [Alteromonas sp. KUL42]TAP35577.1 imidazole glycerol phosphate synthase subunit HisH [Alteromonas sp. KUL42]GEA07055.1 imidazole glycerol phosphate synthase subunit HisH 2 [Alteromonas sp. KUL42]